MAMSGIMTYEHDELYSYEDDAYVETQEIVQGPEEGSFTEIRNGYAEFRYPQIRTNKSIPDRLIIREPIFDGDIIGLQKNSATVPPFLSANDALAPCSVNPTAIGFLLEIY